MVPAVRGGVSSRSVAKDGRCLEVGACGEIAEVVRVSRLALTCAAHRLVTPERGESPLSPRDGRGPGGRRSQCVAKRAGAKALAVVSEAWRGQRRIRILTEIQLVSCRVHQRTFDAKMYLAHYVVVLHPCPETSTVI